MRILAPSPNHKRVSRSVLTYSESGNYYSYDGGKIVGMVEVSTEELISIRSNNAEELIKQVATTLNLDPKNIAIRAGDTEEVVVNHLQGIEHRHLLNVYNNVASALPFGAYKMVEVDHSYLLKPISLDNNIVKIGENRIHKEVAGFFKNKPEGRRHKKGILTYGNPGNGKTSDIMELDALAKEEGFYVLIPKSLEILESFRSLFTDKNTVIVLEEVTQMIKEEKLETILSFLDGEFSWKNCVTVATTNYPNDFPANIIDRPGRIDTFIEYKNPTNEDILNLYLKFDIKGNEPTELYDKKLSYDYVSFIFSTAKTDNVTVSEAYNKIKDRRKFLSDTFKGKMGL